MNEYVSRCPACGGDDAVRLRTPKAPVESVLFGSVESGLGLWRCRKCGLEYVNPRPDATTRDAFYNQPGYVAHSPVTRDAPVHPAIRIRLAYLASVASPGRLLDFGCGSGGFLLSANNAGWDAVGLEPSTQGRLASGSRNLRVYADLPSVAAQEGKFTVITAFHVVEHLSDPQCVLKDLHDLLSEQGALIVEVPNLGSLRALVRRVFGDRGDDARYRAFPLHLCGFRRRSLHLLLSQCGLEPCLTTTYGWGLEIPRGLASAAARRSGPAEKEARKTILNKCQSWLGRGAHCALAVMGVGENLIVAARRRPAQTGS